MQAVKTSVKPKSTTNKIRAESFTVQCGDTNVFNRLYHVYENKCE